MRRVLTYGNFRATLEGPDPAMLESAQGVLEKFLSEQPYFDPEKVRAVVHDGSPHAMPVPASQVFAKIAQAPRATCPRCGRAVFIEHGFFASHREDPPSSVLCPSGGTAVER